jgi:hypothetical protein
LGKLDGPQNNFKEIIEWAKGKEMKKMVVNLPMWESLGAL